MTASRREVIGVDVDGVLANYVQGFAALCRERGKAVSAKATRWNWYADEMTEEEAADIWAQIVDTPDWWHTLAPYPDTLATLERLNALSTHHDIYYITHRPVGTRAVTEAWLRAHGMTTGSVVVTRQKGKVCQALGVTCFVDDKPGNCLEVYRSLPPEQARVYLFAQPWNAPEQDVWREGPEGIRVADGWSGVWAREAQLLGGGAICAA